MISSILATVAVSLVSLVGVSLLALGERRLQRYLSLIVAFAAGTLLGDVFIHLLPEALESIYAQGDESVWGLYVLGGFVGSFVIERFVHWHHCRHEGHHAHRMATMNLVGDSVHNLFDGVAIAAAFAVSAPVGIATTVAIILHEIPQELGDFGVLLYSGYSRRRALLANLVTALTSILGAIIASVMIDTVEAIEIPLILIAAGNFVYIAATDIMPELNRHDSVKRGLAHLGALVVGIVSMYLLLSLE